MEKRGRKRTPDQIKLIKGTFRQDRANQEAPLPDPGSPRAPSWLSPRAHEWFGVLKSRIEDLGLASKSYTEMLALAAERIYEIEELTVFINENGRTFETKTTNGDPTYKTRPEVSLKNDAMKHLQSLLSEFGLSPAAVGKTKVSKGGERKPRKSGFAKYQT